MKITNKGVSPVKVGDLQKGDGFLYNDQPHVFIGDDQCDVSWKRVFNLSTCTTNSIGRGVQIYPVNLELIVTPKVIV